ncbi:MAG TPA: hypothetical protein VFQ66_01050 [Candidatus Limnocylindria bacterium]|nr:hypothetical protein [Candidatus Limnocylindria bacterium]
MITLEQIPQGGWFQHLSEERVIEWSALAAAAAGVVVGGWLGGVRAVSLFLAYFVLITAHAVEGALEAARVCQDGRLGCLADLPVSGEDALFRQSPSLIGIAIGSVLALLIRRLPSAPLYPLEAAGACALTLVPLGILAGVHDLRAGPVAVIASMPDVPALLAVAAQSAAAGLFITARSPSPRATTIQFVAVGAVFLLPASTSAAMHGRGVEAFFALAVASLAVGVVTGLATVLGRRLRASAT